MVQVAVIGIGQSPVGEHWDGGPRELAVEALHAALQDAQVNQVDALYVGNILGDELNQQDLCALMANALGMHRIPVFQVESACDSGAAALQAGYLAIAAGQSDRVAIITVEKMTGFAPRAVMQALASSGNCDYPSARGLAFDSLNALWLRCYLHEFDLMEEDFAYFALNAHYNPFATFPRPVAPETYPRARLLADSVSLLDATSICEGVGAIILSRSDQLDGNRSRALPVPASSAATHTPSP